MDVVLSTVQSQPWIAALIEGRQGEALLRWSFDLTFSTPRTLLQVSRNLARTTKSSSIVGLEGVQGWPLSWPNSRDIQGSVTTLEAGSTMRPRLMLRNDLVAQHFDMERLTNH